MRIGILTFHRAYNYGAFLQCYSLQKYIQDNFPEHTVEVIDYSSKNMQEYYNRSWKNYFFGPYNSMSNKSLFNRFYTFMTVVYGTLFHERNSKSYFSNKKLQPFFNDCYEYLPLTEQKLVSDSYDEIIDFINSFDFDVIIVGSDAVWNDLQTNVPSVFYLDKRIKAHKLSYAASSYGMKYRDKSKEDIDRISQALSEFEFVGVRDNETALYVNFALNEKETIHTCDPTLTLDLSELPVNRDEIKSKLQVMGIDFSKPVIGVMGDRGISDMVKKVYGQDVQTVSVYEENADCTIPLLKVSPFEWATVFSFFEATFTSYFHGTIFSLKNGTPTVTIERNTGYAESYVTKTKDLLCRLGLEDYYFAGERQTAEEINKQISLYKKTPQRERIINALSNESKTAEEIIDYLKEILD